MTQPKSVVIDGIEFVADEVPPRRRGPGRPPLAAAALTAMDNLGVDSVRVFAGATPTGALRIAAAHNEAAKRNGIPVRFVGRNHRTEGGRKVCDMYAVRVKDGDQ